MMNRFRKRRAPSSIVGVALDTGQLSAVLMRRSNGSLQMQKTISSALALNPLSADPELVGREIRNYLTAAGIRERRCVVSLPLNWALVVQVKLPEVADADLDSFLQIEAERGFPYAVETLLISRSLCQGPEGERHATLTAIPRTHLMQLEKALRAARLKPLSFGLSTAALQPPNKEKGEATLALSVHESHVDLQATWGGGVAALRALDGTVETEKGEKRVSADLIARAIRITLGQLPEEVRAGVKKARLFGRGDFFKDFAAEISPVLSSMGLRPEVVERYRPEEFRKRLAPETEVSPAASLAAEALTGEPPAFDFLPPKTSSWQQLSGKVSSKKLVWAGGTAAAVIFLVAAVFLIQQWQLSSIQNRWRAMEPKVRELEGLQQQIRKFRPWFDTSFPGLRILRKLTEAFPEEGSISAKTVEIRGGSVVTCSGVARDSKALIAVVNNLRSVKEIGNIKIDSIRGTPVQFTFSFQWLEGGAQ